MPAITKHILLILVVLALIPPALIMRARTVKSPTRRTHIIQDMDNQPKFRAQHHNPILAARRAMRPPVAGTVARGEAALDDHLERGLVELADGSVGWATTVPSSMPLGTDLLERGRESYGIYCAPCHGQAGYGDGMVHQRAVELMNAGINGTSWVQPKNVHDPAVRDQPIGQVYNTITNGVRNMAGYASQVRTDDRWAIAAWVKVMQRSQNARPEDVPAAQRETLPEIDLMPEGDQ